MLEIWLLVQVRSDFKVRSGDDIRHCALTPILSYLSSYSFLFTALLMTSLSHIPADILQSDSTEDLLYIQFKTLSPTFNLELPLV